MKRPVKIMLIVLGVAALAVLVVIVNVSRSQSLIRGVEVNIRYGRQPRLVSEQTVVDSIFATIPGLSSTRVADVDRSQIVAAAAKVPYLRDISASVSVSGRVVVRAAQRRPIARLFYGGHEYYFDNDGVVMPASRIGQCNVLVATGSFVEPLRIDSLNAQTLALVEVANFLDSERRYGELFDQIHVEKDGDIIMVPKVGDHVVELGTATNLDEKFANLLTFYRRGMPRAGWNTYSKLSLKFDNQVVATK